MTNLIYTPMDAVVLDDDQTGAETTAVELTVRKQRAYDYRQRVTQRVNRRLGRVLLCSATIFAWAVVLSLMVGATG